MQKRSAQQSNNQLVIGKAGKQKLTKSQDAFNKLTTRITQLQKDIEKRQLKLDKALQLYGKELRPVQLKRQAAMRELIIGLWEVYGAKRLSKANLRLLKSMLQFHVQQYFELSETEPDKAIQDIFSKLEGIDYAAMMEEEKEMMQKELKQMFEQCNIDIEGLDLDDETAMQAKMAQLKQQWAEQEEREEAKFAQQSSAKKKKPPTAAQAKQDRLKQEAEAMKQKSIGTVYKQLAKLFHPDLEPDAAKRAEKEILMKELTAAYDAKNMHALLTLELRWIHQQNNHLETLTEEKLNIYLQILREQARDLEMQRASVINHPQYSVLANRFGYSIQQYPVETIQAAVLETKRHIAEMEEDIAALQSDYALKHVNHLLKGWKQSQRALEEDMDFFSMFDNEDF